VAARFDLWQEFNIGKSISLNEILEPDPSIDVRDKKGHPEVAFAQG
jgi:hypothetical protein